MFVASNLDIHNRAIMVSAAVLKSCKLCVWLQHFEFSDILLALFLVGGKVAFGASALPVEVLILLDNFLCAQRRARSSPSKDVLLGSVRVQVIRG
jgi:hypothetical protein